MSAPAPPGRLADAPHRTQAWADLLVEELVRQGVELFCLAPGSRSTPLAVAVWNHPVARALVHVDERGTAFAALGYGRATGRPAAWVTTSGTAVANGMPAVVEADVDHVPLLLLTADRPAELRHTGANQTIAQPGFFGERVRWHFDLPAPAADVPLALALTTAAQAVHRATRSPAGPVHLNVPFREPLAPTPGAERPDLSGIEGWLHGGAPYTRYAAPVGVPAEAALGAVSEALKGRRGVVAAGRLRSAAEGRAAAALATALGWPLLPDIGSQVRLAPGGVAHYDALLASERVAAALGPEAVVHVGGRSTSKRLAALAEAAPVHVVLRGDPTRFDPAHAVTHRLDGDVAATARALAARAERLDDDAWLDAWRTSDAAAAAALAEHLDASARLSEPLVARLVARHRPPGHGLVLAASMPVRDADTFAGTDAEAPGLVATNRGASGIDGTLATAVGLAHGLGRPVTALVGDLALLHDLNSLGLVAGRMGPAGPPVTVVCINNDGGGIFSFLPIREHEAVFEPLFGTPHGLGFEDAARLYGLAYHRPETPDAFARAYAQAATSGAPALVEVVTERDANVRLHRSLLRSVADAVEAAVFG